MFSCEFYDTFWNRYSKKNTRQPLLLSTVFIDEWYDHFYVAKQWKLCIELISRTTTGRFSVLPLSWANIYLFKVNNRNTRKRCETCPTLKKIERRHSLWTCFIPTSTVSITDFQQANFARLQPDYGYSDFAKVTCGFDT